MTEIFGIPTQALFGQLLIGLINGSFYALLSLGLAVIFGLLNIINFTHGAQYMMGAFCAWFLLEKLGVGYWEALVVAPILVGILGALMEDLQLVGLIQVLVVECSRQLLHGGSHGQQHASGGKLGAAGLQRLLRAR
jgi:branched-chain amino acid transport system permease protein